MSVLKGTKGFYQYDTTDTLAYNLKTWLEYGLIEKGAYTNVTLNGSNSGLSELQRSYDDRYGGEGRVYEGIGGSWVWESGVSVTGDAPIQVSGVYVNDTFYELNSSIYSHTVDYENGKIIFASGVSETDSVKCEYTFRDVEVYLKDSDEWKVFINDYQDRTDSIGSNSPSGIAAVMKHNRVWTPCVFIDTQDKTNSALQLGGGDISTYGVYYDIFSEIPFSAKRLADIIDAQYNKRINLFDLNTIPFPINYDGSLSSGAKTYPELADRNGPYFYTNAWIEDSRTSRSENLYDIYIGKVVQNIQVDRYLSVI